MNNETEKRLDDIEKSLELLKEGMLLILNKLAALRVDVRVSSHFDEVMSLEYGKGFKSIQDAIQENGNIDYDVAFVPEAD